MGEEITIVPIDIPIAKAEIKAISYSISENLIAIGKSDGTLDLIENVNGYPLISRLYLSNVNSINCIIFYPVNNGTDRLFVMTAVKIYEIDLHLCKIKYVVQLSITESSISMIKFHNMLILCSNNGCLLKFDVLPNELKSSSYVSVSTSPLTCMAFNRTFRNYVFAGGCGEIFKVNIRSSHAQTTTLNSKSTIITSMDFLKDILVSGDNCGIVTFWNSQDMVPIQNIKSHTDVIFTLHNVGNDTIAASGKDPIIVLFKSQDKIFTKTLEYHGMEREVFCLTNVDKDLFCGGATGELCMYDLHQSNIDSTKRLTISELYQNEFVKYLTYELFIYKHKNDLLIHSFDMKTGELSVKLSVNKKDKNIISFSMSKDLKYLAYSTDSETRILKLHVIRDKKGFRIIPTRYFDKVVSFKSKSTESKGKNESLILSSAKFLKFTEFDKRDILILVTHAEIQFHEFKYPDIKPLVHKICLEKNLNIRNISHVKLSKSGHLVAFATLNCEIFIYNLKKHKIEHKFQEIDVRCNYTLNVSQKKIKHNLQEADFRNTMAKVAQMTFYNDEKLFIMYTNRKIQEYDLLSKVKNNKWCSMFNENLSLDWIHATLPSDVQYLDSNKLFFVSGKALIKMDMSKKHPQITSSLFVHNKRMYEKSRKKIHYMINKLHKKITLYHRMNDKHLDKRIKVLKNRIKKYESNLRELRIKDDCIPEQAAGCFSWYIMQNKVNSIKWLEDNETLLCVSPKIENLQIKIKKKRFGIS